MALSMPAFACLLIAMAVVEGILRWLGKQGMIPWLRERTGRSLSATAFDEYTTIFAGSKRVELDHREEARMFRQDEDSGATPRAQIDLVNGTALIPRPPAEPRPDSRD